MLKTHFMVKDNHRLKVRGWKKIFHVNRNDKKVGITVLYQTKQTLKQRP